MGGEDEFLNAHDSFAPYLWPTSSGSCSTILLRLSLGSMCAGLSRNSGCQAVGIEAGVSLRLLANVILHVEFRVVWVVALPRLQVPEITRNYAILSRTLSLTQTGNHYDIVPFSQLRASSGGIGRSFNIRHTMYYLLDVQIHFHSKLFTLVGSVSTKSRSLAL